MKLYLYSCQDLGIRSGQFVDYITANIFYQLEIDSREFIDIYPITNSGIIVINKSTLLNQQHNNIIFHKVNENAILCEIKPFISNASIKHYSISGGDLKLVYNLNQTYIYFNDNYYGCINQRYYNIKFEKINKNNQEYGVLYLLDNTKFIIWFDSKKIIFCGQYIDSEILKDRIQIYSHQNNIFNVGQLINYDFNNFDLTVKSVQDRGNECNLVNTQFITIYFLEAVKCKRYKYAYNKLSYELKTIIDINTLSDYFKSFNSYYYLSSEDAYITLLNNKIVGVYHFSIKNNLIDNIY